jgi:hypothetical protein
MHVEGATCATRSVAKSESGVYGLVVEIQSTEEHKEVMGNRNALIRKLISRPLFAEPNVN